MWMTSKLGLPEVSSITAFWRCCCSGVCSDETWMPVRSVNSFSYFCSVSPRGLLMRFTSIFVPANFFQFTWAKAGRPPRPSAGSGARPSEERAAA